MLFNPKQLQMYPQEPGVYLMKNDKGTVLYIGKAKNLQSRLKQYFNSKGDGREMLPYLMAQVTAIDTLVALTEKDALILENNLIKKHKPKYNVLLKDDKSFISLILTQHKWPMLKLIRFKGAPPKYAKMVFGPYTNALKARQMYDLALKFFPLRQCSDAEFMNRTRPCLLYDIKKCPAPCVNKCSPVEYQGLLQGAVNFLKGNHKETISYLEQEMAKAAEALAFETAAVLLQTIQELKEFQNKQHIENFHSKDTDIIALYREGSAVLICLLLFRQGMILDTEHFSFHNIVSDTEEILESFLLQRYKYLQDPPSELLISHPLPQMDAIGEILSEAQQKKMTVKTAKKGLKADWIQMAEKNAKTLFQREQEQTSLKEKMLLDLQETLHLNRFPQMIACIDTSNLSGTDAVACVIYFENGKLLSSKRRWFKIRQKTDDYHAMKEVLLRHFSKAKEQNEFPDLLIVDGGKGQLNIALEVFRELEIASVDVIAVTKQEGRHDKGMTEEKIYLPLERNPLSFDSKSPLLFLLQNIRDEAHKQAISFHKKQRTERLITSSLDGIKGIGPMKKQKLLRHFKSLSDLKKGTKEEFLSIPGISIRDWEAVQSWIAQLRKTV